MANNIGRNKNSFSWKAILAILGILGIFAGMVFYLDWAWETYGRDYALLLASLFVATVVGLAVIFTLKLTKESLEATKKSLELTRATQRPFLNVLGISVIWSRNDGSPTPVNYFVIHISNTGIFPATQVSVVLNVSKTDSDNQRHLFVVEREIPSICFPSEEIVNLIFREEEKKKKLTVNLQGKMKVQVEISYQNKLTQKIHKTIRSYLVQYFPTAQSEPTPLRKEDFWD